MKKLFAAFILCSIVSNFLAQGCSNCINLMKFSDSTSPKRTGETAVLRKF
jgi:hypothetical protein